MEKGFTIRDLTARGWKVREDLNFRDDGTKFRGLESPEGLIATYTKVNGEYYLALRLDYLDGLTYDEYSKLDSYKLCDEFNGVDKIDADKVTQNASIVMGEYNSLLKEVNDYKVDMDKLVKQAEKEFEMVYRVLYDSNITIDDIDNTNTYELTRLKDYRKAIKEQVERTLSRLAKEEYSPKELRNLEYRLEKFGYLTINEKDSFYIKEIKSIISKMREAK